MQICTLALEGSCRDVLMRRRCVPIQMLAEGEKREHGGLLSDAPLLPRGGGDECIAGGSGRRLFLLAAVLQPSPRRPGPPARSTEIDRAAS